MRQSEGFVHWMESLTGLEKALDVGDLNLSLIETLNYLQNEFHCQTVMWFKADHMAETLQASSALHEPKFHALEDSNELCPMIVSRPVEMPEFNKICQFLAGHWSEILSSSDWMELKFKRKSYSIVPINDHRAGGRIGYFVLCQNHKISGLWKNFGMSHLQQLIGRFISLAERFDAAKRLSYIDSLTQLYNQRYLAIALDREIGRMERYGGQFSVLFMDIDYFKTVNDNHGHLTGSGIITQMGQVIRETIRESDYGFRFGGDEFVLILAETATKQAEIVAERLRKNIASKIFNVGGGEYRITVSIGIANCPDHARTKEQVLALADEAMYYGKNTTKNIVYVAS